MTCSKRINLSRPGAAIDSERSARRLCAERWTDGDMDWSTSLVVEAWMEDGHMSDDEQISLCQTGERTMFCQRGASAIHSS